MSLVRSDSDGLYIFKEGQKYRAGEITGYSHAFNMSVPDGLKDGDKVKVSKVSQSPLIKITVDDKIYYWANDYEHEGQIARSHNASPVEADILSSFIDKKFNIMGISKITRVNALD